MLKHLAMWLPSGTGLKLLELSDVAIIAIIELVK
jgi:hypothetical protein